MTINFRIFLLNYFQLNLKYKKPIFFFGQEENIGFSWLRQS
jgi:hypothetical protein